MDSDSYQQVTRSSRVAGSRNLQVFRRLDTKSSVATSFDTQPDTLRVLREFQHAIHPLRGSGGSLMLQVRVQVRSNWQTRMTEQHRDLDKLDTFGDQQTGGGVPEVVEAHSRQVSRC